MSVDIILGYIVSIPLLNAYGAKILRIISITSDYLDMHDASY